jgi:hypothetical protein
MVWATDLKWEAFAPGFEVQHNVQICVHAPQTRADTEDHSTWVGRCECVIERA